MFAIRRAAVAATAAPYARLAARPFSVMGARLCNYRSNMQIQYAATRLVQLFFHRSND